MTIVPIHKRLLAGIIDVTVFLVLSVIAYLMLNSKFQTFQGQLGSGYSYGVLVPTSTTYLILLMAWIIFISLTEFRFGQSIGKRLMKIKVVQFDFSKTTLSKTLIRHLFDIVDITLLIGLFVALTNKTRQRLGDLVANTIVITK